MAVAVAATLMRAIVATCLIHAGIEMRKELAERLRSSNAG